MRLHRRGKRKREGSVADGIEAPPPTGLGAPIPGWVPNERSMAEVVGMSSQPHLLVYEEERIRLQGELAAAPDDLARLEALLILNAVYERQVAATAEMSSKMAHIPSDGSDDVLRFWSWTNAWMGAAEQDWRRLVDQQNALVARLDPALAQTVADTRATPRLRVIVVRAEEGETTVPASE